MLQSCYWCSLVSENFFALTNRLTALVTLQFTDDHSKNQNIYLLNELEEFIDNHPHYIFYLRNHPGTIMRLIHLF